MYSMRNKRTHDAKKKRKRIFRYIFYLLYSCRIKIALAVKFVITAKGMAVRHLCFSTMTSVPRAITISRNRFFGYLQC